MTSTNRPTTSNRKPFLYVAGRAVLAFGIAGGLLHGGQTIVSVLDGEQTDQATCSQKLDPIFGLVTVCENYADRAWGGDF